MMCVYVCMFSPVRMYLFVCNFCAVCIRVYFFARVYFFVVHPCVSVCIFCPCVFFRRVHPCVSVCIRVYFCPCVFPCVFFHAVCIFRVYPCVFVCIRVHSVCIFQSCAFSRVCIPCVFVFRHWFPHKKMHMKCTCVCILCFFRVYFVFAIGFRTKS